MLSPETKYAAYLVFKVEVNSSDDGYCSVLAVSNIQILGKKRCKKLLCLFPTLDDEEGGSKIVDLVNLLEIPQPTKREDGWLEIELGEYYNTKNEDVELRMEVKDLMGKESYKRHIVQGIEFRPKRDTT